MHKQRGLSIIEMMVALVISSLLIIGITQVYLDNRENTLFQQSQGTNIENTRFSILLLEQTLAKTGYRRRPDETMEAAFPADSACGGLAAGQVAKRLSDTSFCVRYQPAFPTTRSCDGNIPPGETSDPYARRNPVTETFELDDGELRCNGQPIANGIEAINFVYGVNNSDEKEVDEYRPDPEANQRIRAVQFAIMSASPTEVGKTAGSAAYEFWFSNAPTDKRLYTMLSSSTSMRNLMP
ncbi:PilW family protein [Ectopseudomonas mendocina]|uniref:PilW family protein n=1 Tax=Ectopseudomonas mendocina TaxID=300 RepID=UPI00117AD4D9|nr:MULTISPECIES: PilW family protein [Pseudomonas]TRO36456.1 prepilin-type N-terminal cleavage/methylation domain-containing protein [Pseudomonas sp. ALS1131]